jgi:hypothetical protein
VKTEIVIMRPDQPNETRELDIPEDPDFLYDKLLEIVTPLLDGAEFEHVYVQGHDGEPADMFIDDRGLHKDLPFNRAASDVYRRAHLKRFREDDPEDLPYIAGPAVLFSRRVWV